MYKITLKLFASLEKYKPSSTDEAAIEIAISPGITVEQVALEMGVPLEKIQTISVNQAIVGIDCRLYDGDTVILFPNIAGG